jgi:YVTN family beta-propeller protein
LSINAGELALVDPVTSSVSHRVSLARGAVELGLFDNGRRVLVINGHTNSLTLLDLATPRVVAQMPVPGQPDQLAFSREYAYVRSQQSANVQVVNLAQARDGRLQSVSIPMGRSTPADALSALNVASVFAPAPEGNGILQANPGDGSVYRYAEGMMVPVGSFSNYRRQARALLVLDTSLVERASGHFETSLRIEHSGRYDLVVRNLRPAVTACFVVEARGVTTDASHAQTPPPALLDVVQRDAHSAVLRFNLKDAQGRPLDSADVRVLAMQLRGTAQVRSIATRYGPGQYTATLFGLNDAAFELLVQAQSLELSYERGRLGRLQWPPVPAGIAGSVVRVESNLGLPLEAL